MVPVEKKTGKESIPVLKGEYGGYVVACSWARNSAWVEERKSVWDSSPKCDIYTGI